MSDMQEFYAASVEEAVDKASAALGVARDQLEFEILDRGSTGFLGIGARDARVLAKSPGRSHKRPEADKEDLPESPPEGGMAPVEKPPGRARAVEDAGAAVAEAPYDLIVAVDDLMTALIEAMGFEGTVDAYDAGEVMLVDVTMQETGLFIGQKGETIDAVQYLLNIAIYKRCPFFKRIVVDCEGYRQRRVEAIQGMAHRTARRVRRERRPLSLPPMSAAERRVVHLFLKENPDVTTFSDGEEDDRRVIVSPV